MLPTGIQSLQTRLLAEDISAEDFFRFINTTYEDEEVKEVVKTVLGNVQLEIKKTKLSKNLVPLFSNLKSLFEDYFCEKLEDDSRYLQTHFTTMGLFRRMKPPLHSICHSRK